MDQKDLVVTPVVIIIIYMVAYVVRPHVTDKINRRYFFPALTVRVFGALALGFIYQFYYDGGDTFNYHTIGSRFVWQAFMDSPLDGLKILFSDGRNLTGVYEYTSKIYFYKDPSAFFVVKIASLFDLITFCSYSATAVLFSVFSFVGVWMLFLTFYRQYPSLHTSVAVAALFIPSTFFWGSGLLKDTIILGCLGIATYQMDTLFIQRRVRPWGLFLLWCSLYMIFKIKIFILLAYIPAVILWVVAFNYKMIRSTLVKVMTIPFVTAVILSSAYFTVEKVGEADSKYSLDNIRKTAQVTAYDIRYWSGREAGSGYTLEVQEWTPAGMIAAAPAAINVSLFRPYLWEVRNPLMLMSSVESLLLLLFTGYVFLRNFKHVSLSLSNANVLFCLTFSVTVAFAVGISTFNFGTLTRYRIPMLPFYLMALIILMNFRRFKSTQPAA